MEIVGYFQMILPCLDDDSRDNILSFAVDCFVTSDLDEVCCVSFDL